MMMPLLFLLCGGAAAFMAHRGLMIFHDASRSYANEMLEGQITRREWLAAAWPLSFGFAIGIALPYTLATGIVMVHLLFLGTDLIGAAMPGGQKADNRRISVLLSLAAGAAGMIFAAALYYGAGAALDGIESWPVPLSEAVKPVGQPVILLFSLFPVLVVQRQFGTRQGIVAFLLVVLTYWFMETQTDGAFLPAATGSLFIGMIVLLILASREIRTQSESIIPFFAQKAARLKKGYAGIFAVGALYSACVSGQMLAEGPQSQLAMAQGDTESAVAIALARALSFLPLKSMTSLTSGTFPTDGFGFVPTAGLLAHSVIPAALVGGLVMLAEAILLVRMAKVMELFPGFRDTASHIRTSMTQLLEIGVLIGCFTAALQIGGEWGGLAIVGLYLFNEHKGAPIPKISVSLIGFSGIFLWVNVTAWMGF